MSVDKGNLSANQPPLLLLLALLLCFSLIRSWAVIQESTGVDFYHYWAVPRLVAVNFGDRIYTVEGRSEAGAQLTNELSTRHLDLRREAAAKYFPVLAPTGTPLFYSFFWPLSQFNYSGGFIFFQLTSTFLLIGALFLLCNALHYSLLTSMCAVLLLTQWFAPWQSDLEMANVSRLITALLIFQMLYLRKRSGPFRYLCLGFFIGCTILLKPIVLFVAPNLLGYYFLRRNFLGAKFFLLGGTASALFGYAVSAVMYGSFSAWRSWYEHLSEMAPTARMTVATGNFTPMAILNSYTGMGEIQFEVSSFALVFVLIIIIIIFGDRLKKVDGQQQFLDEIIVLNSGVRVYVAVSRLVWLHYYLLLSPLILALWALPNECKKIKILSTLASFMIAINPLSKLLSVSTPYAHAVLVCGGAAVLGVATVMALLRADTWGEGPETILRAA